MLPQLKTQKNATYTDEISCIVNYKTLYYSEIKSRKLALKLVISQRENTNHDSTGEYFRRPHVTELKKDESTL